MFCLIIQNIYLSTNLYCYSSSINFHMIIQHYAMYYNLKKKIYIYNVKAYIYSYKVYNRIILDCEIIFHII